MILPDTIDSFYPGLWVCCTTLVSDLIWYFRIDYIYTVDIPDPIEGYELFINNKNEGSIKCCTRHTLGEWKKLNLQHIFMIPPDVIKEYPQVISEMLVWLSNN